MVSTFQYFLLDALKKRDEYGRSRGPSYQQPGRRRRYRRQRPAHGMAGMLRRGSTTALATSGDAGGAHSGAGCRAGRRRSRWCHASLGDRERRQPLHFDKLKQTLKAADVEAVTEALFEHVKSEPRYKQLLPKAQTPLGYLLNDAPGSPMSPPRGPMGGGAFIVARRGTVYVTPAHTSP